MDKKDSKLWLKAILAVSIIILGSITLIVVLANRADKLIPYIEETTLAVVDTGMTTTETESESAFLKSETTNTIEVQSTIEETTTKKKNTITETYADISKYKEIYGENYSIIYAYDTNDKSVLSSRDMAVYDVIVPVVNDIKKSNSSLFLMEKAAHDWICKHCTYIETANDQEAYGVVVEGKAVCAGYAKTFKIMMDMLDIECIYVPSSIDNHAWNLVKLDGEWYLVDVTWDDTDDDAICSYFYFNVTDADHKHKMTDYNYATNSGKYNYYNVMYPGQVFTDYNSAYFNFVNSMYDNGSSEFCVILHGNTDYFVNNFESCDEKTSYKVSSASAKMLYSDYYLVITIIVDYMDFGGNPVFFTESDLTNYISKAKKNGTSFGCWLCGPQNSDMYYPDACVGWNIRLTYIYGSNYDYCRYAFDAE